MFKNSQEKDRFILDFYCRVYEKAVEGASVRLPDANGFTRDASDVSIFANRVAENAVDSLREEFSITFGEDDCD